MRPVLLLAAGLLTGAAASAAAQQVYMFGVGATESCATWLSSPESEFQGFTWLLGYWSGMNVASGVSGHQGMVGSTTDSQGTLAEVKKVCARQPSLLLVNATQVVFEQLQKDGR